MKGRGGKRYVWEVVSGCGGEGRGESREERERSLIIKVILQSSCLPAPTPSPTPTPSQPPLPPTSSPSPRPSRPPQRQLHVCSPSYPPFLLVQLPLLYTLILLTSFVFSSAPTPLSDRCPTPTNYTLSSMLSGNSSDVTLHFTFSSSAYVTFATLPTPLFPLPPHFSCLAFPLLRSSPSLSSFLLFISSLANSISPAAIQNVIRDLPYDTLFLAYNLSFSPSSSPSLFVPSSSPSSPTTPDACGTTRGLTILPLSSVKQQRYSLLLLFLSPFD